jgi:hypothetical protein
MKLELKHIAPYLPYGLKIASKSLSGVITNTYIMELENYNDCGIGNVVFGINQIPILRPLSDLTREIEVNGENIVPITELLKISSFDVDKMNWEEQLDYSYIYCELQSINWYDIQLLLEWHFDIFRLIEQGLAIDINTLND